MNKDVFKAVQVTDRVYWVGAIDWSIRDFHGYLTGRGTTYNAFLVLADKITLIDTVKAPYRNELMARIASVIDPGDISVIISNHSEMDHSGCLIDVIDTVAPDAVYASPMGVKALTRHFGPNLPITEVKSGESIDMGNMEAVVMETRMLHWPDSMVTWLPAESILFSQDAFGMHLASYERFADELDDAVLDYEAAKYFANILLPYAQLIPKVMENVGNAGIKPSVIAPDHGPIYRRGEDIEYIFESYLEWAKQEPAPKAVVTYDTMWGSTDLMGRSVCEGLASEGVEVKSMSLKGAHRSDVATEILDAGALIVGSPTINNNMFPTVADVMSYIKGLKPKNLVGGVFGSYGWSGESVGQLESIFDTMKIERVAESVKVQYVPDEDDLKRCYDLGKTIGKKLTEAKK